MKDIRTRDSTTVVRTTSTARTSYIIAARRLGLLRLVSLHVEARKAVEMKESEIQSELAAAFF